MASNGQQHFDRGWPGLPRGMQLGGIEMQHQEMQVYAQQVQQTGRTSMGGVGYGLPPSQLQEPTQRPAQRQMRTEMNLQHEQQRLPGQQQFPQVQQVNDLNHHQQMNLHRHLQQEQRRNFWPQQIPQVHRIIDVNNHRQMNPQQEQQRLLLPQQLQQMQQMNAANNHQQMNPQQEQQRFLLQQQLQQVQQMNAANNRQQINPPQMQQRDFWQLQFMHEMEQINNFKQHEFPLATIKKIMKSDKDVITRATQDSRPLFAKACEMFILDITHGSWCHTVQSDRRVVQRSHIVNATREADRFDFVQEIVSRGEPKEEVGPSI